MITLNTKSNYLQKVVVLLLVLVLLFNAAIAPADASATLTAATIAVVGAALVASGLTFTAAEDMTEAVHSLWDSLSDEQQSAFLVLASNAAAVVPDSKPFVFKLTNNLITGITAWLSSLGATAESSIVSIPSGNGFPLTLKFSDIPAVYARDSLSSVVSSGQCIKIADNVYLRKWYYDSLNECGLSLIHYCDYSYATDGYSSNSFFPYFEDSETGSKSYHKSSNPFEFELRLNSSGYLDVYVGGVFNTTASLLCNHAVSIASSSTSISLAPDYTPGFSGSKELDSDTDVVVPTGTGKLLHDGAIDSDFVGTFTPDMARDAAAEAEGELTTVLDWVKSIATSIGTFFDVSQFSLDFSPFQVGLSSVFPFCIPFDFFKGVKLFSASAADFSFDIDLETDYFTIDHTVDLSPFRIPILFFRYIVVFWFSWILISRTRDLMKW